MTHIDIAAAPKTQNKSKVTRFLWGLALRRELFLVILIVLMIIVLSSLSPTFLSYKNLMALASNEAMKAFVLIGVLMLLVTRDFDLSVGAGMSLVGVGMAWVMAQTGSLPLGLLVGLAIGLGLGVINGFLVTKIKMASFIATLGTMYMARSLCNIITQGKAIPINNRFIIDLFNSYVLGLPLTFILMVIFAVFMTIILAKHKYFKRLFFTGVNEQGAIMVGINTIRLRWAMFIFSGLMVSIAGIVYLSMLTSAVPLAFSGLEMKMIAMAIIGGASLKGGQGSVIGAILGLLLVTLIGNAMTVIGISPQWEGAILGSILVVAAILDLTLQKRAE